MLNLFIQQLLPLLANLGLLSLLAWMLRFFMQVGYREGAAGAPYFGSQLVPGIVFGFAAITLMFLPFQLETGIFADSRGAPIFLAGVYGGPWAGLIAGAMAAVGRYQIGGAGMPGGVIYIIVFALVGVLGHWLAFRKRLVRINITSQVSSALVTTTLTLPVVLLLPEDKIINALLTLWPQIYIANVIGIFLLSSMIEAEHKRKDEEMRLLQDRDLYTDAFQNSKEAMLMADSERRIISANEAFYQLTGFSPDETANKPFESVLMSISKDGDLSDLASQLDRRGNWQGNISGQRKTGDSFTAVANISFIGDQRQGEQNYVVTFSDISELFEAREEINRLAHYDALTGALNRYSLFDRLEQSIKFATRNKKHLAVLFIDVDKFKDINDRYGHKAGDQVLQSIASRLSSNLRDSDLVARYGGDEFVVVLNGLDSPVTFAEITAAKLLMVLGKPHLVEENEFHCTPSIGISIFPSDGETPDQLIHAADRAMYSVKGDSRNNFEFYSRMLRRSD